MFVVVLEEVVEMKRKWDEMNGISDLSEVLVLTQAGGKIGYGKVTLDEEQVREYLKNDSFTHLIFSGDYKKMVKDDLVVNNNSNGGDHGRQKLFQV
jgi:hypothetical protein